MGDPCPWAPAALGDNDSLTGERLDLQGGPFPSAAGVTGQPLTMAPSVPSLCRCPGHSALEGVHTLPSGGGFHGVSLSGKVGGRAEGPAPDF